MNGGEWRTERRGTRARVDRTGVDAGETVEGSSDLDGPGEHDSVHVSVWRRRPTLPAVLAILIVAVVTGPWSLIWILPQATDVIARHAHPSYVSGG